MAFLTVQAGNEYFVRRVGPHIQGAQTITEFFLGLRKEGYNSKTPDYFSMDMKRGMLFNRISNIEKWGRTCNVAF